MFSYLKLLWLIKVSFRNNVHNFIASIYGDNEIKLKINFFGGNVELKPQTNSWSIPDKPLYEIKPFIHPWPTLLHGVCGSQKTA